MNDSELNLDINTIGKDQSDWHVDIIVEQIWSEMNGTVTRSSIQEMLTEVIPRYEKARIQTFVPIFILRDAVKRLRSMQTL